MLHISRSVTINRPRHEVYDCWRDLDNLPRVIPELESVALQGGGRSHWVVKAPAGTTVEWDAEITTDEPGLRLAWRTLDGASVPSHGEVRFADAPAGRGTELRVDLRFEPPAGAVGQAVAAWLGHDPVATVREALRRYKQVLETGEVLRSDGSPHGAGQGLTEQHPAQPAAAMAVVS
jgi:uncharacterized membrane protein